MEQKMKIMEVKHQEPRNQIGEDEPKLINQDFSWRFRRKPVAILVWAVGDGMGWFET